LTHTESQLTLLTRHAEDFSHDWKQAEPSIESSFTGTIEAYNASFVESGNNTNNNIVIDPMGYK